jgi:membrane-associated phospholipid phosphatase
MKNYKLFIILLICIFAQSLLYGQGNINPVFDSIPKKQDSKTGKIIGVAIPSAMITYGLVSLGDNYIRKTDFNVRNSLERNNRFWYIKADDYLQYAPAVAAYTMKFCKIESAHNIKDMTILYGLSNIVAGGITYVVKNTAKRERPDKSNNQSFPSGHTQTAFVAAEFLYQEYKDKSVWISIGGYGVATFVGIARVYNNKHWVSDVVAGAGIGILSTKAIYWIYPYFRSKAGKKNQQLNAFIFPGYSNGNISLNLSQAF